jgi:hypothetical protein
MNVDDTSIPLPSIQNDPSTSTSTSLSTPHNGSVQSLSHKLRIIRYSQGTTAASCNKHFLYESFPLTQELMRSRKNSLSIDMFRRNYSRNISTPDIIIEKQEESIQTESSFFERCDKATQTESLNVGCDCYCCIS